METRKKKELDEKYFRRILRTTGSNFILGNDRGGFYLTHTRRPLVIIPGPRVSTIELTYTIDRDEENMEEVITGLMNLAFIRDSLEKIGYDFEGLRINIEGRDLFYRIDSFTPSRKDLEKVIKDCNSLLEIKQSHDDQAWAESDYSVF